MLWWVLYNSLWMLALAIVGCLLPVLVLLRPNLASWFWQRLFPRRLGFDVHLWIHAVSVGEIKVALALLDRLQRGRLDGILVTTTTSGGLSLLQNRLSREQVRLLPFDLGGCYRRLLGSRPVPDLLIIETELWPNLFRFVTRAGKSVVIVNGRLGPRTARRAGSRLLRETVSRLSFVLTRSERDSDGYASLGVPRDRLRTTGNIKFDFTPGEPQNAGLRAWLQSAQPLVVFASISDDEVTDLAEQAVVLHRQHPELHLLWAPRHLKRLKAHIQALAPLSPCLRTELTSRRKAQVVILDSFGELASCYRYAEVSLVGGSFNSRGGQNFLESLQAGTPALIGPHHEHFAEEASQASADGAIVCLQRPEDVTTTLEGLLKDPRQAAEMRDRARQFIGMHQGAVGRTLEALVELGVLRETDVELPEQGGAKR